MILMYNKQMMRRLATNLPVLLFAIVVFTASVLPGVAHADNAGQAFSISPPLLNLQANPGQTVTARITLTNISSSPMVMSAQANDFAAKDETGSPNIILNTNKTVAYPLRTWIQLPASFTLTPKQTRTIDIPIAVPKSGEPGGHYGVIRFTGAPESASGSNVSLSASIGTLVLLQVSGNVQERASIADFYSASPKDFKKNAFFQTGPVGFVTRISDDGNIHIQPTGTITVKNMLGRKTAAMRVNGIPGNAQDSPKNILPSSIRRFEAKLDNKWLFGRYTAQLDLTYGQNHRLTATKSFWVIPYKIVVPAVIGIIVIVLGLWFGIKKYNAHIIKRAGLSRAKMETTSGKTNKAKAVASDRPASDAVPTPASGVPVQPTPPAPADRKHDSTETK